MSSVLAWLGDSEWGLPSVSASKLALYSAKSKANLKVSKQDTFHWDNLVYPGMKSRSNHKLSGAHLFLALRIIRKELDLLCCLHHHCLLGRRNYWPDVLSFKTRFQFRTWKTFWRPGALLDIFLDEGSVLNYSWIFSHLFFFFFFTHSVFVKCVLSLRCFDLSSSHLYSLGPLNYFPALPEDCSLSWGNLENQEQQPVLSCHYYENSDSVTLLKGTYGW